MAVSIAQLHAILSTVENVEKAVNLKIQNQVDGSIKISVSDKIGQLQLEASYTLSKPSGVEATIISAAEGLGLGNSLTPTLTESST